jgi:DNA-binding HxlR family transcriptional regulator
VLRYSELRRNLNGITNMMLSQSLKELEGYDLIKRTQYPEIPPKVEYTLTATGHALLPAINELAKWGATQMTECSDPSHKVLPCKSALSAKELAEI